MGIDHSAEAAASIDLSPVHLHLVQHLLKSHLPDVPVWAYGSRVKGNARQYSDLDLVAFTGPEHATQLNELREAFEESDLPFRVDLFSWHEMPSSFHPEINRNYAVIQPGER